MAFYHAQNPFNTYQRRLFPAFLNIHSLSFECIGSLLFDWTINFSRAFRSSQLCCISIERILKLFYAESRKKSFSNRAYLCKYLSWIPIITRSALHITIIEPIILHEHKKWFPWEYFIRVSSLQSISQLDYGHSQQNIHIRSKWTKLHMQWIDGKIFAHVHIFLQFNNCFVLFWSSIDSNIDTNNIKSILSLRPNASLFPFVSSARSIYLYPFLSLVNIGGALCVFETTCI